MSRASQASVVIVALLLVGTLLGGMSWIVGHAVAHHSRVIAGGTWCC
jgi:hypothetical protein